jgi:hypothetical protein
MLALDFSKSFSRLASSSSSARWPWISPSPCTSLASTCARWPWISPSPHASPTKVDCSVVVQQALLSRTWENKFQSLVNAGNLTAKNMPYKFQSVALVGFGFGFRPCSGATVHTAHSTSETNFKKPPIVHVVIPLHCKAQPREYHIIHMHW